MYCSYINRTPLGKLQQVLSSFLEGGSKTSFSTNLKNLQGIESSVLQSGLNAHERGGHGAAENAIAGRIVFERARLDRGIIIIGTTGSNAPFLGLFGTVLGIIKAFADLATQTNEGAASVMAGISEALVATAIGLLVAIPAVVLYNYLRQRNKNLLSNLQSMSHLMLARLDESLTILQRRKPWRQNWAAMKTKPSLITTSLVCRHHSGGFNVYGHRNLH